MPKKPIAAGKSSYDLIDTDRFFTELGMTAGTTFLDVACGSGAYALSAAAKVGDTGTVHAVDLWEEGIASLRAEIASQGVRNIHAAVSDVSTRIPVEDRCVDVCLMATVLHDLIQDHTDQGTLGEVRRVVKPLGTLAILEFKKIDGPPGPPVAIRLSAPEVADRLKPFSFRLSATADVGPYNYLALFTRR